MLMIVINQFTCIICVELVSIIDFWFCVCVCLQEKMRGRNKLVPRLLGITRESIMRVDENTKEVLKTWPLTTVRRWAASPNSFTLVGS